MNAIKHGFFSKFLLVQHADGKESQREYDDFYADVRKHYQPADWLEELWVEKIAVWSWRLRRLIRCESGQIARALAGHSYEIHQSKAGDLAEPESASLSSPEMDAITDHLFLPEKEELEKLLRYEAMINRQLNHAIAELERLHAPESRTCPSLGLQNKANKSFVFMDCIAAFSKINPSNWHRSIKGGDVFTKSANTCWADLRNEANKYSCFQTDDICARRWQELGFKTSTRIRSPTQGLC